MQQRSTGSRSTSPTGQGSLLSPGNARNKPTAGGGRSASSPSSPDQQLTHSAMCPCCSCWTCLPLHQRSPSGPAPATSALGSSAVAHLAVRKPPPSFIPPPCLPVQVFTPKTTTRIDNNNNNKVTKRAWWFSGVTDWSDKLVSVCLGLVSGDNGGRNIEARWIPLAATILPAFWKRKSHGRRQDRPFAWLVQSYHCLSAGQPVCLFFWHRQPLLGWPINRLTKSSPDIPHPKQQYLSIKSRPSFIDRVTGRHIFPHSYFKTSLTLWCQLRPKVDQPFIWL